MQPFALARIRRRAAPRSAILVASTLFAAVLPAAVFGAEAGRPVDCGVFTAADAAPLLGVAPGRVVVRAEKVTPSLWTCAYDGGAGKGITFNLEAAASAKAAAAAMERYRADLELAAGTAAFKDRLPQGAWSEILGDGLGDENVWTDVNGSFTARKGRFSVQVTRPAAKVEQVKAARAVLAKLPAGP